MDQTTNNALAQARAFLAAGQASRAIALLTPLAGQSNHPEVWFQLGIAHGESGEHAQAENAFRHALDILPDNPNVSFSLALSLQNQGKTRWREALKIYARIPETSPRAMAALANSVWLALSLDQYVQAADWALRLIAKAPDEGQFHFWLGLARQGQGLFDMAIDAYQAARDKHWGDEYSLALNTGSCLCSLGKLPEALEQYRRALSEKPGCVATQLNIASTELELGLVEQAIQDLRLIPGDENRTSYLHALNYDPHYNKRRVFEIHRHWGENVARNISTSGPAKTAVEPDRPLNIGYVSADFRMHPVMFFLDGILRSHDHQRYKIHCYSDIAMEDDWTRRLRNLPGLVWHSTYSLSNEAVAGLVRADGIDILVDLGGHTSRRITLFAQRVAPIQVAYLGYPNTSGLDTMDYRITDELTDIPGEDDAYYTEKLLRLGRQFYCYSPPASDEAINDLPALTRGHLTFGSFNRASKVNSSVIALWADVLRAIPTAKLLLRARLFDFPGRRQAVLDEFADHGIDPDRIETAGYADFRNYLHTYHEVDIVLDTFPWNGHTQTAHGLWMGVPTLTLAGDHHAARFGMSMMTLMDMPNFIAHDRKEFIGKAGYWAEHLQELAKLRMELRQRLLQSPLCDAAGFTRRLEAAYREIWRNWCATVSSPP